MKNTVPKRKLVLKKMLGEVAGTSKVTTSPTQTLEETHSKPEPLAIHRSKKIVRQPERLMYIREAFPAVAYKKEDDPVSFSQEMQSSEGGRLR